MKHINTFLYSVALQWKLDIRSKALLVTCYAVPLLSSYGRYLYLSHAGNERNSDTVYDCNGRIHGRVYRTSAFLD